MTILLLVVPTAAFGQGTIEGNVRDVESGQGLVNAWVDIPALGLVDYTAATGAFSISGVAAGTHTLEIRLLGFGLHTQEVTVAAGQTLNLDIQLEVEVFALDELIVVGSRTRPRTVTESMVPVDVIPVSDIARQGTVNLQDQLRTVVPSFNVNAQPISDASTVVRPAMLRNLAPDHTLVLINGKRRHRSSIIDWHGGNGVAFGSQGPDISAIPAIALRQVEVLRDGAAAQYGSDAIAGVLNFQLKDAASGGAFEYGTGRYRDGDGEAMNVAANVGLPLGAGGFANLSLEYGGANPTNRSAPRNDAIALIAAGNTDVWSDTPQVWGSPEIEDDLKLFGNFGYTSAYALPQETSSN